LGSTLLIDGFFAVILYVLMSCVLSEAGNGLPLHLDGAAAVGEALGVVLPEMLGEVLGEVLAEVVAEVLAVVRGVAGFAVDGLACNGSAWKPAAPGECEELALLDCALLEPVGPAVAPLDGDADGDGDGVVDPPALFLAALPLTHDTGTAGPTTPRKLRIAALPSAATSVLVPLGISTTSWSLPWTTTVEPVTPVVLMRSSRICRAWVICEDVGGGEPFGVCALKITRTPPTRSRPSFGVCLEPKATTEYRSTRIAARAMK
jgi:hypothetical protein